MKKFTIAIAFLIVAVACKKEKRQGCYYEAVKDGAANGTPPVFVWRRNRPSNDQVQRVQDSCICVVSIRETCLPCDAGYTDPGGFDVCD